MKGLYSTLTVRETAGRLGCTTKYVFDLLYSGRFKGARKVDGRWVIPSVEVEQRRAEGRRRKQSPRSTRGAQG